IKDKIAHVGKPATLTELHILLQGIDTCYWEHKSKITHQAKHTNPPPSNPHTSSSAKSTPNPTSSTSIHNSDSRAKAPPPHPSQPDLSHKLGKDGKLTSEERNCHFDLKLCMFCGNPGHMEKDCCKSTSKAAKAHAATASTLPDTNLSASTSEETKLNVSTLSNPNSLTPSITILSYDIPNFPALLDSGSSDCFIDTTFITKIKIKTYSIPPILLHLFNGTSNSYITRAIDLSVHFATSNITSATFYVTLLDSACSLVLGHNWLTCYNPLINWVFDSIMFCSIQQQVPTPPTSPLQSPESPLPVDPASASMPCFSNHKASHIALINAAAFALTCHLEGSMQFSLHLCSDKSKL
ncbi:hypothetical protein PAXRUDRAFT_68838, partial [Paxillus rubicundulus Ve08.2h10]